MFVEFKCSTLKLQVDNSITWPLWKIKSFSSVSGFHSVTFGLTKRVLLLKALYPQLWNISALVRSSRVKFLECANFAF